MCPFFVLTTVTKFDFTRIICIVLGPRRGGRHGGPVQCPLSCPVTTSSLLRGVHRHQSLCSRSLHIVFIFEDSGAVRIQPNFHFGLQRAPVQNDKFLF